MLKQIKQYDRSYSKMLRIFNPYETFPYKIHPKLPKFDITAYNLNPRHQFVYDKLFVANSQGMICGELKDAKDAKYPIFIKPRYGHKTSSSKNCYKIKSYEELKPFLHKKEMMWSEFVNSKESMTDFVLINGEIVYQITYIYSEKQNGFADDWKYISPENKPPEEVVEWVKKYMVGYTGPCNVQYRSTKIIEVGLRFARSGMYIESTHNEKLIKTINAMWETKVWTYKHESDLMFEPFYSFKCWSPFPILCLLPQHLMDVIMVQTKCMPFYEYYFEPTGKRSTIFFQFLHKDFKQGMKTKKIIEMLMLFISCIVMLCLCLSVILFFLNKKYWYSIVVLCFIILLSLDNSLDVICTQITNQKQFINFFNIKN
jgi:hypothetical protein